MVMMRTPIRHLSCGEIMGWYLLDKPREPDAFLSSDFERLDGSKPGGGDVFDEQFPHCGEQIVSTRDMRRCCEEAA